MPNPRGSKPAKKPPSLTEHALGIERLLGILGYSHLRARVARGAVLIESGPPHDPFIRLRFRPVPRDNWRVDVRTHAGRWEPIPYAGPRGNMVASIHQDFPWLLAAQPGPG